MKSKRTEPKLLGYKRNVRVHAKKRAKQRHDLVLNKEKRREIEGMIRAGCVLSMTRLVPLWRRKYCLIVDGRQVEVVYDRKLHTIVTFLASNKEGTPGQ